MIDINNAVQLNVNKNTARVISTILVLLTTVILMILLWVVITKDDVGEDWLLTLVALFPSILIITSGWFYIQLAKKSFNSDDLLEETARILTIELPRAIVKRILYYTKFSVSDMRFHAIVGKKYIIDDILDIKNDSLLVKSSLKKELGDYLKIKSNVTVGIPACKYIVSGSILKEQPLLNNLEISVQININRVEVIYHIKTPECKKIEQLIESTVRGTKGAGYDVNVINEEDGVKFEARMNFDKTNLLLDSSAKLFLIQDIAVMTGYLIGSLKNIKL